MRIVTFGCTGGASSIYYYLLAYPSVLHRRSLSSSNGKKIFQSQTELSSVNMVVSSMLSEDHLVPKPESSPKLLLHQLEPPVKKRKVNFNLTIDIKHEQGDDACVPQGPNSLSDFSDGESLSEERLPTTPGGRAQVNFLGKILNAVFCFMSEKIGKSKILCKKSILQVFLHFEGKK